MSESVHPPRHFWRRFAALGIDLLCASLVGAVLALLLSYASAERSHLSKGVFSGMEHCKDYEPIPQAFKDWANPLDVKQATVCTYRPYFVFPYQRRLILRTGASGDAGATSVFVNTYAVDKDRKIKPLVVLDTLLGQFVLLLGSAFCVMRFGTTPGKWLLELRVDGQGCALCRELRRTGPFLVLSSLPIFLVQGMSCISPNSTMIFVESADPEYTQWRTEFAVYGVILAAFTWFYARPLLWWQGATGYDKATGFRVVRR